MSLSDLPVISLHDSEGVKVAKNRISASISTPSLGGLKSLGGKHHGSPFLASKLNRQKTHCQFYLQPENQEILSVFDTDRKIATDSSLNKFRRSLVINKDSSSKCGFSLQTYVFLSKSNEVESLSYVDYIELNSPANFAGLRVGDIILSINGRSIAGLKHNDIVQLINSTSSLRLVVLFADCAHKVELCSRALKLKKLLVDKAFELDVLNFQENRLLKGLPLLSNAEILDELEKLSSASHRIRSYSRSSFDSGSSAMVNQAEIELDDIQLHLDAPVASENDWVSIVNVEDISEEKNLSYNLPVAPRSEEMDHADMASNNVRLNRQLSAKDAEVSHL